MDNRPIGVFDSGLGGLTAVRELLRVLPGEDVVYFGDTARVPYGTRSPETILKYARQDIRFLSRHDIKLILVACGTVSTAALPTLSQEPGVPLVGVVRPAVEKAAGLTRNGRVGLIATPASIRSRAYERYISVINPDITVVSRPCPLLVPLVEDGRVTPADTVTKLVLEEYLTPLREQGIDTLLLGCTHYPLLSGLIASILPDVQLVSPGSEAVRHIAAADDWGRHDRAGGGQTRFFVSDNVEGFARMSGLFLEDSIEYPVELVDMEAMI